MCEQMEADCYAHDSPNIVMSTGVHVILGGATEFVHWCETSPSNILQHSF